MAIGGDPGAVEAAADRMATGGAALTDVGDTIRSRARAVSASWDGDASDAAHAHIDMIGTKVLVGADAVVEAAPVYRTYAAELRAAQAQHEAGEVLADQGRAEQRAAAAHAVRASERPVLDPGREPALAAAQRAHADATAAAAEGEAEMAAAVEREERANEDAARRIRALTERVRGMTMAASAAPVREASEDAGDEHGWFYDAVGGLGDGLWAAGPGAVGDLLSSSPFESDQEVAEDVEGARQWLEDWYGADTDSGVYRGVDTGTQVATLLTPGGAAKGLGKVDDAVEAGQRVIGRADDAADAARTAGPRGPGAGLPPLTAARRAAVVDYTGDAFEEVNGPLWRGTADETIMRQADELSDALTAFPAHEGLVYRGTQLPDEAIARYEPGQTVTHPAFTSTSTDPAEAFPGNVQMFIQSTTGKDVSAVSAHGYEAEVLFDKGTEFRVVAKTWDDATRQWEIVLREVAP